MSRQLNIQQKQAIDPKSSARVMANAGAGKTFVLTARVLRLLLQGTHPGKILCLTYTKAAAAEMRERVNKQLEEWVLMDDGDLRSSIRGLIDREPDEYQVNIAKQLFSKTLESSPPPRIQTIHSFCQDILKRFPLESGIQPYFEVVDDITSRELIKETTQKLLSRHNVQPEVTAAIDYIASESGEFKFNEIISEIISQRNRIADMFEKANKSPSDLIELIYKFNGASREEKPENHIKAFMQFPAEKLSALKALQSALESGGKRDNEHAKKLALAISSGKYADYCNVFCSEKERTAYKINYFITGKALERFAPGDEWILREQSNIVDLEERINKLENLEFTAHVINLAAGILGAYEAIKQSRAVIDYNDLIYTTKKLLTSGNAAWVLYKLDGGIDHILVDEAQDTSPDQWQIILALLEEFLSGEGAAKNERTVFIVGDEKQSIYSFQGADQRAFNLVTNNIMSRCREVGMDFRDLGLLTSFRSVEAVLKLADEAFLPEAYRASVTSKPAIIHEISRIGEGGKVEIWPLVKAEEKEVVENWSLPLEYMSVKNADLLLAEKIADTIAGWINSKRILVSQNRPVKASDFLILLRSRGEIADMIISRLKRNNIPVSGSDRLKITEHIAVQDLLALASFLLLPADDLSLACVLKSPLFGITEDELFELAYKRESTLWNSLRNNPKFQTTSQALETLFANVDYLSVYELYSLVLDQMQGRKKFISRLGYEVNDIIDEFLDLSVNFERSHTNSLQHFVSWVKISNMEIKRDMEASGNQVRIMTVHGSKGLEAPIVFLADTAKLPKSRDQLIWQDDYFYAYKTKKRTFAGIKQAIQDADDADYAEYLRLLYVAVTRAREELYITGSLGQKNSGKLEDSWYKILEAPMLRMGVKDENGIVVYETPHLKELKNVAVEKVKEEVELPQFLKSKLPPEAESLHKIESEFSGFEEERRRGTKIHKVLEVIGSLPEGKRRAYATSQLPQDADRIIQVVETYPELFSKNAQAEVPVIGRVGSELVIGRIDRLVVKGDEVQIIDFKTTPKPSAHVHESYIKQMDRYRQIIAPQFPGKKVTTAILWIANGRFVTLP